jgi:phage shock protein PspC (stress-responsive transcriptional regulator)
MTSTNVPNPDFDTTGAASTEVTPAVPVAERGEPVFRWLRRQPLRRSSSDRWLGGVCSALAQQLGVSATVIRAVVAGLALLAGTGVAAYLLAWLLLPNEDGRILAEDLLRTGTDAKGPRP